MATRKTTTKKKAAKVPDEKQPFLLLTSECGDMSQTRFRSAHPTQTSAEAALKTALKATSAYGNSGYEIESAVVVKVVGRAIGTKRPEYELA